MHSRPKLLVVKWLGSGLNVTVRVRYRKRVSFLFLSFKVTTPLSCPPGLRPGSIYDVTCGNMM